jgi:uncharacterized protein (DUF427 family)
MTKAIWNNVMLAESEGTVMLQGNHYFPPESVNRKYLGDSQETSLCLLKGRAHYYDIRVGDQRNRAAAWFYPKRWIFTRNIKDYVAFGKDIRVVT